jgi:argininosuccinate synthase
MQTIALAYSGGLDTSIIVPWLREHYDARVICVAADVGQGEDELRGVREKAIASGAEECYVEDMRREFVEDFIFPTLRAGAVYNRKYLLGTSMARPIIAKRQVDVARQVGADALAHGCTGKGNDQVRFELTYMTFAPDLKVIAPWREAAWTIRSREDALEYAASRNIPVAATAKKIYSRDRNLWHISHEGGVLEDPNQAPPKDLFIMTTDPEDAPNEAEVVTIGFEAGTPVSVNGEKLDPVQLILTLNAIGGRHGVGRADIVSPRYADLVYEGRWWTTEKEAYDAFINVIEQRITGTVSLKLYKGTVSIAGRASEQALYDERFVTFGEDDGVYQQSDAAGFIRLYGLPQRVRALKDRELARLQEKPEGATDTSLAYA